MGITKRPWREFNALEWQVGSWKAEAAAAAVVFRRASL